MDWKIDFGATVTTGTNFVECQSRVMCVRPAFKDSRSQQFSFNVNCFSASLRATQGDLGINAETMMRPKVSRVDSSKYGTTLSGFAFLAGLK